MYQCASSFTPSALSSGLSGTGAYGVQKAFALDNRHRPMGSASSFALWIAKQKPAGGS